MQSRKDQVQAVRFVGRRMATAVLGVDPNSRDQPLTRQARSAFAGVLIAALMVAGVGVLGLIRPGGATSWRDGKSLIVEKGTGTRYVYRNGVLYPVLNYASALLILGDPTAPTRSVSAQSLRAAPHGPPVGIPGAPESLPKANDLLGSAWQVCARPGQAPDGTIRSALTVAVTDAPPTGRTWVGTEEALVVRGPSGNPDVVWHGLRLRVRSNAILSALGLAAVKPIPVNAGWLNLLKPGPDLAAVHLDRLGEPATTPVAGKQARVGQVFSTGGVAAERQFLLLARDGLRAVTPLQAAIQLADPRTAAAYPGQLPEPLPISAAAAGGARSAADPTLPLTAPRPVAVDPQGYAVCFDLADGDAGPPRPYLQATAGPLPVPSAQTPVDAYDTAVADQASVTPGRAVLVIAQSEPTHADGAWYLVTDLGARYPLGEDAIAALGYADAKPVRLPDAAVSLFPAGPRLDPADAEQLQTVVPRPQPQTVDGSMTAATNAR